MALRHLTSAWGLIALWLFLGHQVAQANLIVRKPAGTDGGRVKLNINDGWRFWRSESNPDGLIYDQRPDLGEANFTAKILKPWILPSGNDFISDPAKHHVRPAGNPGGDVEYVQKTFDDSAWDTVNLPHDWAINGPFYTEEDPIIGGGMGRLPVHGVGWYRRKLSVTAEDAEKSIYLDVDGALSYAIVWLNGNLVGGWPYGYNSFCLDLTPYLKPGNDNQLAIRVDNPPDSARWYPGGGIYRNVWLTKVSPTHIGQSGTYIISKDVSSKSAILDLIVQVETKANASQKIDVVTDVHIFDSVTGRTGAKVAEFPKTSVTVQGGQKQDVKASVKIRNPRLWGPVPQQKPNLYVAVTRLLAGRDVVDTYETQFGIRTVILDGTNGLSVNGEKIVIQGINNHHDLGAIGAAFNVRAAERRLEQLLELGCNTIRMSHNPPATELLELTDRMGFLVLNEIFDSWVMGKTASDFFLIFPDWHEQDLRSFIRRDRNHPSVFGWSYGNEVGEQQTDEAGAAVSQMLKDIAHEEDPSRLSTASENYATPDMPFPRIVDFLSINYQGAGIRDTEAYSNLAGIARQPLYPAYHAKFPNKMIVGSETASTVSTRGTYVFPVTGYNSAPVNDTSGGDPIGMKVSAYELYTAGFGSSPDKVFAADDKNPFVAGEMVWTGVDYLGEPTPYYSARSSYSGIIDLAGFKKDRFYLYQSRWRPDLRTAHILPHWNWPERVGLVTPVHVFTGGDEAELFLNEKSLGRQKKAEYTYRFRWDDVIYEPGELYVVTYKNGKEWARDTVRTTGAAAQLKMTADRTAIKNDGLDLSFITVEVADRKGNFVADADTSITFSISGPGEIVATDNGDPADMVSFASKERKAYSGLALAIVRFKPGENALSPVTVTATADGLVRGKVTLIPHP